MIIDVFKVVSLFFAVWWSLVNGFKLLRGEAIPSWNIIAQWVGIVAFCIFNG